TATTNPDGTYSFPDIPAGSYTVTESDPSGFTSTTPNSLPVNLTDEGSAIADFGDMVIGTISGMVYNDTDGDGVPEAGEDGIGGVTVTLTDAAGTVVATATTNPDGTYTFEDIPDGSYTVVENNPSGSSGTSSNTVPVNISNGASATADFGSLGNNLISGIVFTDIDGDGASEAGESGIGGVTVHLTDAVSGEIIASALTFPDGTYTFENLPDGLYTVTETDPAGYASTSPNSVSVEISGGVPATANFGDLPSNSVSGIVFTDIDGSGEHENGEDGIGGVTVTLTDTATGNIIATVTTSVSGTYIFENLPDGAYTVAETDLPGWSSTSSNNVSVNISGGVSATANFGDMISGSVSGTVFNDTDGDGKAGPG
ncbi:MAG: SdrD B-like domain-containing protein, partial [Desulfococcaceae bacterium]|nr:SdrD B-like domain-containing protein [Desulfococcaceae bacterium]